MKLLEYEAKRYFKKIGIPTPNGKMVETPEAAREYTETLGKPVVIKVQLPIGGRGKAGGIKIANNPEEAESFARQLFGIIIKGLVVEKIYVEEKIDIMNEIYLGVAIDRNKKQYVILASNEGGVDIEEVASKSPEKIQRHYVDPIIGLRSYHCTYVAKMLGYSGKQMRLFASFISKLFRLATTLDAELTEINPLAETKYGFIATDARLNIDNNALYRHKELSEGLLDRYQGEHTKREVVARKNNLTYVELEGDIGIIGNGAGLTMATLDTVMLYGGRAANFLDLGGGASSERIENAVKFVLQDQRTKALLVNVLGGITRGDYIANGIVSAREETDIEKPVVVRLMGTKGEEGRSILRKNGIETQETMEGAAELVVKLVRGNSI